MASILSCALVVILLSFPEIIRAADPAAIAAALPDEASECRYLLTLRKEILATKMVRKNYAEKLIEHNAQDAAARKKAAAAARQAHALDRKADKERACQPLPPKGVLIGH